MAFVTLFNQYLFLPLDVLLSRKDITQILPVLLRLPAERFVCVGNRLLPTTSSGEELKNV